MRWKPSISPSDTGRCPWRRRSRRRRPRGRSARRRGSSTVSHSPTNSVPAAGNWIWVVATRSTRASTRRTRPVPGSTTAGLKSAPATRSAKSAANQERRTRVSTSSVRIRGRVEVPVAGQQAAPAGCPRSAHRPRPPSSAPDRRRRRPSNSTKVPPMPTVTVAPKTGSATKPSRTSTPADTCSCSSNPAIRASGYAARTRRSIALRAGGRGRPGRRCPGRRRRCPTGAPRRASRSWRPRDTDCAPTPRPPRGPGPSSRR